MAPDVRAPTVGGFEVFALSFGTVVGIAWVFLLPEWLRSAGPIGAALAIGAGALSILPVLLCYTRTVRRFPGSGGEIRYALESFGGLGALATAWLLLMAYSAVASFCLPAFQGLVESTIRAGAFLAGQTAHRVAVAATVVSFGAVVVANYRGIETASWLQDVTVVLLVVLTLALGVTAAVIGRWANLTPAFGSSGAAGSGFLSVLATAPFLFAGFNTALQALGDVAPGSSGRRITGALLASIGAAALFYAGVVVAISSTLPRDRLLGLALPALEGVGVRLGSQAGVVVMGLLAILALVTSWNAIFFAATRVLALIARSGSLPFVAGGREPAPAAIVGIVAIMSVLMSITGQLAVGTIVTFVSACMTTVFFIVCAGLFRLERRENRGFPLLATLGSISAAALAILAVGALPKAVSTSPLGAAIIGTWLVLGVTVAARYLRRGKPAAALRTALFR